MFAVSAKLKKIDAEKARALVEELVDREDFKCSFDVSADAEPEIRVQPAAAGEYRAVYGYHEGRYGETLVFLGRNRGWLLTDEPSGIETPMPQAEAAADGQQTSHGASSLHDWILEVGLFQPPPGPLPSDWRENEYRPPATTTPRSRWRRNWSLWPLSGGPDRGRKGLSTLVTR